MELAERLEKYKEIKKVKPIITKGETKTIHCYCRVSTKQQATSGHSIESQRSDIEKYIASNELKGDVVWYVDAAISGADFKTREKFNLMRSNLNKGDILISYSLSRLGRNTKEILIFTDEIKEKGVTLILLKDKFDTSTAMGTAMLSISAMFNTLERELAAERTKSTNDARREAGFYTGGNPPFGYRVDKHNKRLIPDDDEQHVITLIAGMINEKPSIRDSEIVTNLQYLLDTGDIKIRNCKRVYQTYIHKVIIQYNLRGTQ